MSVELYSVSVDFPSGLEEAQLMQEMIDANLSCINVISEDDTVVIQFSLAEIKTEIDIVVAAHIPQAYINSISSDIVSAESFLLSDALSNSYRAERTNLNVVKNVENDITGVWAPISGSLVGFDTGTGIFTVPNNGIYVITLQLSTAGTNLLNELLHIKLRDDLAIICGDTYPLRISNTTYSMFRYSGLLTAGTELHFTLEVDSANLTMDSDVTIFRLMNA